MWRLVAILTVSLLLAGFTGCIGGEDGPPLKAGSSAANLTPPVPLDVVVEQSHDHDNASAHDFAWNVEQVGYHTGFEDPQDAREMTAKFGFHGFAVQPPYAYLCRGGSQEGLVVLNVSMPSSPSFVTRIDVPLCNDVEVSEDGRWVFAGTQRNTPQQVASPSEVGPASPPRGTYVIDAQDPTAPHVESFFALPYNGPHTITTYSTEEDGLLVLHQTYDLHATVDPTGQAPLPAPDGAAPVTHRSVVTELTQAPDGTHRLERIGSYAATGQTLQNLDDQVIVHDAIVAENPLDDTTYLLVAYWDLGVHVVNFEDPSNPELVGTFTDFSPSAFANVHQVRAFPTPIDERWVLVAQPEIGTADETGQLTFIDATDPSNPTKLGHWTLPGNLSITEPYQFSPHNFWLDPGGHVFLSHFHAGVWTISVSGPGTPSTPVTTGAVEPTAPAGQAPGGPMTWGVEQHDGIVYAMDSATGLHALEYRGP